MGQRGWLVITNYWRSGIQLQRPPFLDGRCAYYGGSWVALSYLSLVSLATSFYEAELRQMRMLRTGGRSGYKRGLLCLHKYISYLQLVIEKVMVLKLIFMRTASPIRGFSFLERYIDEGPSIFIAIFVITIIHLWNPGVRDVLVE